MAPLSDYVTGTITLTNGSAAFTGSGTGWLAAAFREGDTILGIEGNPGVTYVIESITDNDAGTLTQPWDGPTGTYEYRMRYLADGQRVTAQARTLIELLGNGNLQALAGLSGTPNTLAMFTGAGAMVEVPRADLVSGANYDVQVDTLPERDAYDGQDAGFAVLVSNTGDGRAAIYSKLSNASADWSGPAYVTGPAVTLDVGSVTPVAFGNDPDVTLTPIGGGYEFDFELPENATFQSGTITTLDPGENATFDLVPVTGGYELNLGVPRGPTGDINGVTPFWQGRITVDANAAAAREGLGVPAIGARADITDFTSPSANVSQLFRATGGATGGPGALISGTATLASGAPRMTFIGAQADGTLWVGDKDGTTSTPTWYRQYQPSNILGTVSQSGGVPTGAIIERGSNANGSYVRYADGTQICVHAITAATAGTSAAANGTWNYPAVFADAPFCMIDATLLSTDWSPDLRSNLQAVGTNGVGASSAQFQYRFDSPQSVTISNIGVSAIGRWF